jgi:Rod binding domain-containing protein
MPINTIATNMPPPPLPNVPVVPGGKKIDEQKLKKASEDFESLLISQLMQSMRRTVLKSKFLDDAPGKEVYQSLFDREISKKMAQKGALGVGKIIYQSVLEHEKARLGRPSGGLQMPASGALSGSGGKP